MVAPNAGGVLVPFTHDGWLSHSGRLSLLEEHFAKGARMARDYRIRCMTRPEIDLCVEWAAAEGWNPGLHDADAFHGADPEGFLVGMLDDEPIGSISAVRYGDHFGFIGFYIVAPAWRGLGYGLQLWQAAMQRLQGRLIGLDGVVAQQANYRRSGFVLAYNNIRYQGKARPVAVHDASIVNLSGVPQTAMFAYDRQFFPAPRTAFLDAWVSRPGTIAKACMREGVPHGYGVARPCRTGYKIGPLFASDAPTASALYNALTRQLPAGAQVQLDVPQANPLAVALAEDAGMTPVFETARMYTGQAPDIHAQHTFGVTSFELG